MFYRPGIDVHGGRGSHEKDTLVNTEQRECFSVNIRRVRDAEHVNLTSAQRAADVDELKYAGIVAEDCRETDAPRVADEPICLECRHLQAVAMPSTRADNVNARVLGQVLGMHIADAVLPAGHMDNALTNPDLACLSRPGRADDSRAGPALNGRLICRR